MTLAWRRRRLLVSGSTKCQTSRRRGKSAVTTLPTGAAATVRGVRSFAASVMLTTSLADMGIGPGAAGRLTIDGQRRSFMQLKLPHRWHAAVAEHGRGTAEEQVLGARENLQVRYNVLPISAN